MKVVFVAISKRKFYNRFAISRYVLNQGQIPINPFMNFDYYLGESVDRRKVREANNELVRRCDELLVFGEISNGVEEEIKIAEGDRKNVRYFSINDECEIKEIGKEYATREK